MATKQQVSEANGVYFITVTCYGWMNLFDRADAYDAVYTWFNVLKKKGHYIPAYVIMPNHFHVLIAFPAFPQTLTGLLVTANVLWHMTL